MNIYPLSFLLNIGRRRKIPFKFQNMMMFSGRKKVVQSHVMDMLFCKSLPCLRTPVYACSPLFLNIYLILIDFEFPILYRYFISCLHHA